MAYATYEDVQSRMSRTMTESEQSICATLLDDAAVIIDTYNSTASNDVKKVVSCRMVIRAMGDGESGGVPIGATQGSMSGLGYSQSWQKLHLGLWIEALGEHDIKAGSLECHLKLPHDSYM